MNKTESSQEPPPAERDLPPTNQHDIHEDSSSAARAHDIETYFLATEVPEAKDTPVDTQPFMKSERVIVPQPVIGALGPEGAYSGKSLCASGGKDGTTMLWDLNESKHLYLLNAGDEIHALVFSPNGYWLCAATSTYIIIFDLEKKSRVV